MNGNPVIRTTALLCLVALSPLVAGSLAAQPRPRVAALPVDQPIVVDGRLDDSAWRRAEVATGFSQREPRQGEPATEKTEVRIVYTPSTLYIGVLALDSQPEAIVAKEMERDAVLNQDDSIAIILDTFLDHRNGYLFETNPNGARSDALITDEGRDINRQWDGVWSVSSRRTADGWVAEIAIPFSTLRFDPASATWGLNIRRMIRRKNEEANWAFVGQSIGSRFDLSQYALFRLSLAGELDGLTGIRPSRQLNIKPFVVGSLNESPGAIDDSSDDDLDFGLDLKWGVSRSLALDLTYNTDFAETEVDRQQVNLTRFSLFFPEKREFFLENAGIFDFGLPSRAFFEPTLMRIFFSRRIGLEAGEEVPIVGGARLTGRVGEWNLGVMDVVSDGTELSSGRLVPTTNFAVVRLKRNVGRRSGIGMIFTGRNERGPGSNQVFGLDFDYKPTEQIDVIGFAAKSKDSRIRSDDTSYGASFAYQSREIEASFEHMTVNEGFRPESGFVLRENFERYNPRFAFRPRIDKWGIRSLGWETTLDYFARASTSELESRIFTVQVIGMRLEFEDGFGIDWVDETQRLFAPFEIFPGIVIPPGLYRFDGWRLSGRSNQARPLSASTRTTVGEFYGGERVSANLNLQIRASKHVQLSSGFNYNDIELPQGDFITRIFSENLALSFTPEIRLNALLQYNDATELVAANIRFNWIYRPGSDLFVVYNHNWTAPDLNNRQTRDRQLIVKFTYLIQR